MRKRGQGLERWLLRVLLRGLEQGLLQGLERVLLQGLSWGLWPPLSSRERHEGKEGRR